MDTKQQELEERAAVLRDHVVTQLEAIHAEVRQELADGERLTGARVELNHIKDTLEGFLTARNSAINNAAEVKQHEEGKL